MPGKPPAFPKAAFAWISGTMPTPGNTARAWAGSMAWTRGDDSPTSRNPTRPNKQRSKTVDPLKKAVSDLFEAHGADAILDALVQRVRDEAAIAHGEGRQSDGFRWQALADDLCDVEAPEFTGR